jgi:tRNA1(Val) A37 N6-methylase TrmN6
VRLLHPAPGRPAQLVLVESVKLAKGGASFLPPLFIHDASGQVSEEMRAIYAGEHDIL